MIHTRKTTRKFTIKGVDVTIKPYYELATFAGYTATAYTTTTKYPLHLYRRFISYTPQGIDEYITAENIAHDFIEYRLKSTAAKYLDN